MPLDKNKRISLEPERMDSTKKALMQFGAVIHFENEFELRFMFKGSEVRFFPYTGWHTGKSINDGRGYRNLIKQL